MGPGNRILVVVGRGLGTPAAVEQAATIARGLDIRALSALDIMPRLPREFLRLTPLFDCDELHEAAASERQAQIERYVRPLRERGFVVSVDVLFGPVFRTIVDLIGNDRHHIVFVPEDADGRIATVFQHDLRTRLVRRGVCSVCSVPCGATGDLTHVAALLLWPPLRLGDGLVGETVLSFAAAAARPRSGSITLVLSQRSQGTQPAAAALRYWNRWLVGALRKLEGERIPVQVEIFAHNSDALACGSCADLLVISRSDAVSVSGRVRPRLKRDSCSLLVAPPGPFLAPAHVAREPEFSARAAAENTAALVNRDSRAPARLCAG